MKSIIFTITALLSIQAMATVTRDADCNAYQPTEHSLTFFTDVMEDGDVSIGHAPMGVFFFMRSNCDTLSVKGKRLYCNDVSVGIVGGPVKTDAEGPVQRFMVSPLIDAHISCKDGRASITFAR